MKTLHLYLTRQVLATLIMTVAVFTFVLLLGNVLREVLTLLVNRQATFGIFTEAVGLLIPFVWPFALPMGMLTATLLIFGRFSADQELTAVRASGISLLSVVTPVIFLSLALCLVSALINMEVAPRSRAAYKNLLESLKAELTNIQLPEGRFIKDFPNYIFYVGKNRRGNLEDVIVYYLKDETNSIASIHAPTGKVQFDPTNRCLNVTLYEAKCIYENGIPAVGDLVLPPLDLSAKRKGTSTTSVSDMTFLQLLEELHDLEARVASRSAALTNLTSDQLHQKRKELVKRGGDIASPVRFQLHRQIAFSFASFGFTLLGIPLGIRVHRRETNVGIGIALLLVAVYYSFILLAQALDTRPEYAPHLIVWLPNFVFQAVGATLLWRANKGV